MSQALREISSASGVAISSGDDVAKSRVRVTVHGDSLSIVQALTRTLAGTGLEAYVAITGGGILVRKADTPKAPPGSLRGRVTDARIGIPLFGVTIVLEGRNRQMMTNEAGRYQFLAVDSGMYRVMARRLGFLRVAKNVLVLSGQELMLDFALEPAPSTLSEVVTTATGERSRVEVGNSIGTIKADSVVATTLIRNMSDLLTARTPGVVVTNTSGLVGAPSVIRIRGVASASLSNDPIIILDGVRLAPASNVGAGTTVGPTSLASVAFNVGTSQPPARLDDLDPNTIESIDVLRGPSASSLYGTDAANGVIVIKTKKGAAGPWRFGLLADQGSSSVPGTFPRAWVGYGHLRTGAPIVSCTLWAVGQPSVSDGTCIQDSVRSYPNPLDDPRLTTLGTGVAHNASASLSGGTEQLREFLSLRLSDQVGITKLSDAEQDRLTRMWGAPPPSWMRHPGTEQDFSGSSRTSIRVQPDFDVSLSANALYRNVLASGSAFANANDIGTATALARGLYDTLLYLPAEANRTKRQSLAKRGYGAAAASYTPLSWLVLHGTVGGDYTLRTDDALARASDCTTVLNPSGCVTGHTSLRGELFVTTVDVGGQATWTPRHWLSLRTAVGEQYTHTTYYDLTAGNNFGTNLAFGTDLLTPSPVATSGTPQLYSVTETRDASATAGWYLEETAALQERLFFTAAFREDVASAFGRNTNDKAPVYPKFSLSWVVSDEPFFPKVSWVSSFRVRTAYGHSGQEARQTAILNNYTVGTAFVDGVTVTGIAQSALGNPDLKPERTTEWEGGFDLSLLDNERVHLEATLYRKFSRDAISSLTVGQSYGIGISGNAVQQLDYARTQSVNLGNVENRGWELTATGKLLETRQVAWELTVNATHNTNKLVTVATATVPQIGSTGNYVGYPLNSYFGHPIVGYVDANGDGILQFSEVEFSKNTTFVGSTIPASELTYVNTIGLWGGAIQVNANFDQVNGLSRGLGMGSGGVALDVPRALVDRTAPLADQAAVIQALQGSTLGRYKSNTFRFAELSMTWNVPKPTAGRLFRARSTAVTFAGRNLALWTNYPGKDPNVATGTDTDIGSATALISSIPQPRSWTLRINLGY